MENLRKNRRVFWQITIPYFHCLLVIARMKQSQEPDTTRVPSSWKAINFALVVDHFPFQLDTPIPIPYLHWWPLHCRKMVGMKLQPIMRAVVIPELFATPTLLNISGNQNGPMKPHICLTNVIKTPTDAASSRLRSTAYVMRTVVTSWLPAAANAAPTSGVTFQ